jgi:hypothetical protein
MTTRDLVPELFCRRDEARQDVPKPAQASHSPSEVVTWAFRFAITGVGNRPFYRGVARHWHPCFPQLPERPRFFRWFKTHQPWTEPCLAAPPILGGIDPDGLERIHPIRDGRRPDHIGHKGNSQQRGIVGGKRGLLLNKFGLVVGWAWATANGADQTFQPLITPWEAPMMVLSDSGFHVAAGDPSNLKLCHRGEWHDRLLIDTVLSMLPWVKHAKKMRHRVWDYFEARLAFPLAAFNVLVQGDGLPVTAGGFVPRSIAEFSL